MTRTDPTLAKHPLRSQVLAHEAVHSEQFRAWRAGTPTGSIDELEREAEAGQGARQAGVPFPVQHGAPAGLELHYDSPDPISGAALIASPAPDGEAASAHTGPGWQLLNEVGLVRVDESTASLPGARLRPEPTAEGPRAVEFVTLPENTHVHVVSQRSEPNQQGWRYVVVTDGPFLGRTGYVKEYLIRTGLPDPLAIEYYIETPNLRLQWLVENHRHFADYDIKTGDDARTLVMAVYRANQEHGRENGVYLNHEKLREAKDPGWWEGAKDKLDEYRRVLRPILQAVELKQGAKIWLPGPGYVDQLKDRKIIPTRPAWKNAFIAVGKGIAGFLSGLIQGFVGSFVDLVVGIWDLLKGLFTTVRDLFSGELLRKGREVYDAIDKYLSGKTPGEVLSDLLNALSTAAGEMWTDFGRRWTADNLFDRWTFRGRVIGYLAAEVLMAVISGGASLAAKLLSKLGKVGKVLAEILAKILRKIDDIVDGIPGRSRSKHEAGKHADGKDTKGKQLPFAIAAASLIAETNDRIDTPTPVLKAQLMLTLQAKYRWITGFGAERHGPRVYTIVMFGSRHVVDPHYTTTFDEPGDQPGVTSGPTKQGVNPPPSEGPNVPETGSQFEKRLADVGPPSKSYFGFLGGDRKSFKTLANEVQDYEKKFQSGLKFRNTGVLSESAREVINRNRRLRELWALEQKPVLEEIDRLTKARFRVRGDSRTLKDIDRRLEGAQQRLLDLNDWANGVTGNKRPDIVEFHPDRRLVEVTDLTLDPFNLSHNFKTQFYATVLNRLTGYSVRASDWKAPTVVKILTERVK